MPQTESRLGMFRRAFCPPALWLAPYQELQRENRGVGLSVMEGVRSLLMAACTPRDTQKRQGCFKPLKPLQPKRQLSVNSLDGSRMRPF